MIKKLVFSLLLLAAFASGQQIDLSKNVKNAPNSPEAFLRLKNNVLIPKLEYVLPPRLNTTFYTFSSPLANLNVGSNTVLLAPCPSGISGTNVNHYVTISGGIGATETVLIGGGSCTSNAAAGSLILVCANTHVGSSLTSATAGIQEAIAVARANNKAVYIPLGSHSTNQTITNTDGVPMFGDGGGGGVLGGSIIDAQFDGNVLVIGPSGSFVSGTTMYLQNIKVLYKSGSGLGTSGYGVVIQNATNGSVIDVGVYGTYSGWFFNGSQGVKYDHTYAAVKNAGYTWANTNFGNSAMMSNVYCTVQVLNGVCMSLQPTIQGLTISNIFVELAAAGSFGILMVPGAGGPLNEINIQGGFIDGCLGSCLGSIYSAAGSSNGFLMSGIRLTGSGASPIVDLHYPMSHMQLSGNTMVHSGTGGVVSLQGITNFSLIGNVMDVSNAAAVPIFLATDVGHLIDNVLIANNRVGMSLAYTAPTIAINGDNAAHTNILFAVNKIRGITGNQGSGVVFDSSNLGLTIPAIASAATVTFLGYPIMTMTGTTGVGAVNGLIAGQHGKFITVNGAVVFTAGATIGNTFTTTQNVPVDYFFDGTKIYLH